jgi:hypothetical protein
MRDVAYQATHPDFHACRMENAIVVSVPGMVLSSFRLAFRCVQKRKRPNNPETAGASGTPDAWQERHIERLSMIIPHSDATDRGLLPKATKRYIPGLELSEGESPDNLSPTTFARILRRHACR